MAIAIADLKILRGLPEDLYFSGRRREEWFPA
jgi:hypothetical protein